MPSKTAEPDLTTWEGTWSVASSQLMNFPLCQIFSVLVMGICAPWVVAIAGYGSRFGSVNALEVQVEGRGKTNWRVTLCERLRLRLSVFFRFGQISHRVRIRFGLFCG